ncbi:hypothetical protein TRICI_006406 [Trichomonascus ciferrii]|uniref:Uncharacterized protein n=1 Tax=Trichomonascus ciferrii TaxID=44093 RepID=A0A642ULH4_9ASCO|nr:hypothetical protein TRICI_006406 [Trichomonascus ciferrii]
MSSNNNKDQPSLQSVVSASDPDCMLLQHFRAIYDINHDYRFNTSYSTPNEEYPITQDYVTERKPSKTKARILSVSSKLSSGGSIRITGHRAKVLSSAGFVMVRF